MGQPDNVLLGAPDHLYAVDQRGRLMAGNDVARGPCGSGLRADNGRYPQSVPGRRMVPRPFGMSRGRIYATSDPHELAVSRESPDLRGGQPGPPPGLDASYVDTERININTGSHNLSVLAQVSAVWRFVT